MIHHVDGRTRPLGISLADQDEAQLGGPASVLVRQKREHIRLDRLLDELRATRGAEQDRVLISIYRLVFPHEFAEESVLWPVIRRVLPDGEALTRQVEKEHQEVNELVTRLDGEHLDPSERRQLLDRLVTVLREDVRDEEDALLPGLQTQLSVSQLRRLGVAWELVRRTADATAPRRVQTTSRQCPGRFADDRARQPARPVRGHRPPFTPVRASAGKRPATPWRTPPKGSSGCGARV